MKLLLIGGSGSLSGRLAEMALDQGHEVWAVTRGQRAVSKRVNSLVCDREDEQALAKVLAKVGVQFDTALDCVCRKPRHAQIDLAVLPAWTSRIVVVSTDSVYEPHHKKVPQDEHADAYMTGDNYGSEKRQMELVFERDGGKRLHYTIFRPGHILGEGFELGCYPEHSRQKELLGLIRNDQPLKLVGGGAFLIHPIYVDDMAASMLGCIQNARTFDQIYCIGGPDVVSNARYFEMLGKITGHPVTIESVPLEGYLEAHPQYSGHLCERSYTLDKLKAAGEKLPSTPLMEGLKRQVAWLDARDNATRA